MFGNKNVYNIAFGGEGGDTISNNCRREKILKKHSLDMSGVKNPAYGKSYVKGRKWLYNSTTKQEVYVYPEKISHYISKGFKLGRSLKMKQRLSVAAKNYNRRKDEFGRFMK